MRCAELLRRLGRCRRGLLAALCLSACSEGLAPFSAITVPERLVVRPLRADALRLTWESAPDSNVAAFVIERRVNLEGEFREVAQVRFNQSFTQQEWIDTDIVPERFYGYRVMAVSIFGERSPPSLIAGARSLPLPGIEITTATQVPVPAAADPDGYLVTLASASDTVTGTIGPNAVRRFSPLRPGLYTATLSGVARTCTVNAAEQGSSVVVRDSAGVTIAPLQFNVACRDPSLGELRATVTFTGALPDSAMTLDIVGEVRDTTVPPAQRVYSGRQTVTRARPTVTVTGLRRGTYDVTLRSVPAACTLASGGATQQVDVAPMDTVDVVFALVCTGGPTPPPSGAGRPLLLRQSFLPRAAAPGATVWLEPVLDASARATIAFGGVQGAIVYDPRVLRFEQDSVAQFPNLTVNSGTAGSLVFLAAVAGGGRSGVVRVARFRFTVIGAAGARAITQTTVNAVSATAPLRPYQDSTRVQEDTLTVVAAGTPPPASNQAPVARAGGPYTGVVGVPLALTGSASSDPDGTVTAFAWTFGDGRTGSGVSPSTTYTVAGTYSIGLTVTDDRGATSSTTTTAVISAAGGPPPVAAPAAQPNGPYAVTAGALLPLSSAGSVNAASFTWALGDGRTVTGASPVVTYATPGTYTLTLTVANAAGATATGSTTVTVLASSTPAPPAASGPVWASRFGAIDPVSGLAALTVTLDLRTDLPETPGPEALLSFVVDSLRWDPAVLEFVSINLGPGITGSSNQANVARGRLALAGTLDPSASRGLLAIATVRFRVVASGSVNAATNTALGLLQGTASTGFFVYTPRITVVEGQLSRP